MKMPNISIVMPVHNGADTIGRAIDSVVNQTYTDWELICVINLCEDNSEEIAQLSATFDNRIKVIKCDEKGIVPALNVGILNSKGNFIGRQDCDDLWHSSKLEKQIEHFEKFPETDILGTQIRQVDSENFEPIETQINYPLNDKDIKLTLLRGANCIAHPSVMFRRRITYRAGLYDDTYPLAEDYHYWLRCIRWYKFANLDEILVDYTSNPNPNYDPRVPYQACQNIHNLYRQIGLIK